MRRSDTMTGLLSLARLIDVTQDYRGMCMMISGQFRSYNRHEEQKNRLVLSVFAREIEFIEEEPDGAKTNHIPVSYTHLEAGYLPLLLRVYYR